MKAKSIIGGLVFAVLFIASCGGEPKGLNRRIDGSSAEAAQKSVEKLAIELSPSDLEEFSAAYGKLALRWAFSNAFSGEKTDTTEFLKQIDGKTPPQIIQMAVSLEEEPKSAASLDTREIASSPPAEQASTVRLNIPFNIDGMEVLITDLRIGKLQKVENRYSFGSVPDKPFLLATVALKNATEGTIIHVQDTWGDGTVTDNFGNVYDPPNSITTSRSDIQGAISSKALRPGEAATDLMIFDVPLENAQKFTLSCDPSFFRPIGNERLKQLSNKSFKLEFARSDIK